MVVQPHVSYRVHVLQLASHGPETEISSSSLVSIATLSDLTVDIIEYNENIVRQHDQPPVELRRQHFAVDTATLRNNSKQSEILRNPSGRFQEAKGNWMVLKDRNLEAMEIWFRVIHGKESDGSETSIPVLKQLIKAVDKCSFDMSRLYPLFEELYNPWTPDGSSPTEYLVSMGRMLYSTWRFNHAQGSCSYHEVPCLQLYRPY